MNGLNKYYLKNDYDYDYEIELKSIIYGFYYKISLDDEGRVNTFTSSFSLFWIDINLYISLRILSIFLSLPTKSIKWLHWVLIVVLLSCFIKPLLWVWKKWLILSYLHRSIIIVIILEFSWTNIPEILYWQSF